jgi:hypothetical protein
MQTVLFGDYAPDDVKSYDAIEVAERSTGETILWAWGDRELPTRAKNPASRQSDPTLRIEVDEDRPDQVLAVLEQVRTAKGSLSQAGQRYWAQHRM